MFNNKSLGRPRRAKTRAPTRPLLKPGEISENIPLEIGEGLDTFFRPGSVTPTSDDCSSSFQAEGSPNHDFASPNLSEGRKTPKPSSRNSPLLKGLMNPPTPRSRSSDNLEKYSPINARKTATGGENVSPLTRRFTGDGLVSKVNDASLGGVESGASSEASSLSNTLTKSVSGGSSKGGMFYLDFIFYCCS